MLYEQLDFRKITKAIEDSYQLVEENLDSISTINHALSEAQNNVLDALSYATAVDKKYLKYTNS
ncbi:DUF3921 family protein [Bacillus pinisoli]|uniref:DUF3921 family protein n=1 Tax=Bacillus pinisoli TaxID=2901866 RepID=UPI001FF48AB1|nr:DUF3921 family protein [Bacillus pinisoli]